MGRRQDGEGLPIVFFRGVDNVTGGIHHGSAADGGIPAAPLTNERGETTFKKFSGPV